MKEMNKKEDFKNEFINFVSKKELTHDDYMNMFVNVHRVTKQGSGMTFSEISEIIKEVLKDK